MYWPISFVSGDELVGEAQLRHEAAILSQKVEKNEPMKNIVTTASEVMILLAAMIAAITALRAVALL